MPSVQIKNVPQDVHRTLRRRAAEAGQSMQEYLRTQLIEQARNPTLDEVLERASRQTGGRMTLAEAARWAREDRESH